jgi:Pectate lyase superfamily protein
MINVRDFGAKGNGTDNDTSGVIDAFNASSGETIYFPKGDYRLTEKIKLGNRPITIMGDGKSLTRLRWEVVDGGIEFTGAGVAANDITTLEIRHISLCTTEPSGGKALRLIWPIMFANPQKKTRITDVEIRGWNSYNPHPSPDYWNQGIWLTNPGGLDISHTDVIGSSRGAGTDAAIRCDSPNNSGAIRHFLSNLYLLQCNTGLDWSGPNEGVYFNNFEIVGCRTGIRASGGAPVYSINNGHCDCYMTCIEMNGINELKLSNLALYHTNNGGTKLSGNLIALKDCARFTVIGTSLYGHPNIGNVEHQNGIICINCHSGIITGNHIEQIKDVGILFDAETNDCHSLANRIANCGLQPFLNQGDGSNTHSSL